ncbi:hypothetical protein PABG_02782 [Paracoccidioides brasiliensis Pb03]|nr:hypothetical protein PABG_02782 [Paracoccidioides brasiliensis Pb03]
MLDKRGASHRCVKVVPGDHESAGPESVSVNPKLGVEAQVPSSSTTLLTKRLYINDHHGSRKLNRRIYSAGGERCQRGRKSSCSLGVVVVAKGTPGLEMVLYVVLPLDNHLWVDDIATLSYHQFSLTGRVEKEDQKQDQ